MQGGGRVRSCLHMCVCVCLLFCEHLIQCFFKHTLASSHHCSGLTCRSLDLEGANVCLEVLVGTSSASCAHSEISGSACSGLELHNDLVSVQGTPQHRQHCAWKSQKENKKKNRFLISNSTS